MKYFVLPFLSVVVLTQLACSQSVANVSETTGGCIEVSFPHPETGVCTHPDVLEAEGYTLNENGEWTK
ncbi:MAG: hypothetical protein AAF810_01315 [Cyanobacteria bacterium P01_D01_bin.36]